MYTAYDVFLSFSGGDTASGFADFLYNSLLADGSHMFEGNDGFGSASTLAQGFSGPSGEVISRSPSSPNGMHRANGASASSPRIMDCHRKQGKSVFPVFYEVEVLDIGRRRGNFEQALFEHERECSTEEMREWMEALMFVTKIRGWISPAMAKGHKGKLVKKVVAKVSSELTRMWLEGLPMFIRSGISPNSI